jgi:hypothetical protein
MMPVRRSVRLLAGALLLASATFSLSTCGGIGGSEFSGGGTGGTGISTGSVTGFGSVVMNGVHFRTDSDVAPEFKTKKLVNGSDRSGQPDREVFAEGMVVTVRHGSGDNNASVIEYRDNLSGPIAAKASGVDNVIVILGHTIVVENAAFFDSLKVNDVVEVSGFVDNSIRIRADFVSPASRPANEFEVKGFVSALSGNSFHLGPLPGDSGATVAVSYSSAAISGLPGGPEKGMYVQASTGDRAPVGGVITATEIVKLTARTEFPDGAPVDLEGLVTTPWSGSGNDLSFAVEGKRVRWDAGTEFGGGTRDDLRQTNLKVQVHGMENGGFLSAARIVFR